MEQVSNPFQACNDIFFKPTAVFATIKEKHNWSWLPFFIVLSVTVLPIFLYFNFVDFDWYMENVIIASMGDVSPAEQDVVRGMMSKSTSLYGGLIATVVILPIVTAIFAIYLNLATKADDENVQGFTDWYGFVWWVSMPSIIGSLISVFLILLADSHEINALVTVPTTLAYLFNAQIGSPWLTFLQSIRLEAVWTIYLTVVGIVQWTNLSSKTALKIALAPYVVIFGLWAVFIAI